MKPLPVLISIPHGGLEVPEELKGRINLGPWEILGEADAYSPEIYDLGGRVEKVLVNPIARVLVDANRPPDEWPPTFLDGAVKDITTYGSPVYRMRKEPDDELCETLVRKYHVPYHQKIREALTNPLLELAIDCHMMAPLSPPTSRTPGRPRPLICLSNVFDASAPPQVIKHLRSCLMEVYGLNEGEVSLNHPFAGGYITRVYGGNPVPWLQIEMNKIVYLESPHSHPSSAQNDPRLFHRLNSRFESALRLFFG